MPRPQTSRSAGAKDALLRAACASPRDEVALQRHGWSPLGDALRDWWLKAFSPEDLRPYVRLLADEPPEEILRALEAWARGPKGRYRPSPSEVMGEIVRERHEAEAAAAPEGRRRALRDPTLAPEVVTVAARALMAGEQPCSCGYHHPNFARDAAGVLRCRRCRGLEPSQVFEAEDLGLLGSIGAEAA